MVLFTLIFIHPAAAHAQSHRFADPVVLNKGKKLFQTNCAVCHGQNAQGTVKEWQIPDENGKYPPPPLNGTAHTWHHSIDALGHTIRNGTVRMGGTMPGWKDTLAEEDIFAVIMWLSSLWPDEIYAAWMQWNNQ